METAIAGVRPEDLAKPVGRLQFAGEATSDGHFSTVHGAIESGWREADRLCTEHDGSNAGSSILLSGAVVLGGLLFATLTFTFA